MNFTDPLASELDLRAHKTADKLSDSLNIISNEPALAMYRIQEHVRNSMPLLLEKRLDVVHLNKDIKGSIFDTEYAINAVKGMESSNVHFRNIQDLLKNSMFMKQQIKYRMNKKKEQMKLQPGAGQTEQPRTDDKGKTIAPSSTTNSTTNNSRALQN